MSDYERLKGRAPSKKHEGTSQNYEVRPTPAALRPLREEDRERAAHLRELHMRHLPEAVPFFKALYELGMVPGWRAILKIDIKGAT